MQVAKWGDSLAVRIPDDVVRELGLKEGDTVELRPLGNGALGIVTEEQRQAAMTRLRELAREFGTLPADFKFDREWANSRGDD